MMPHLPYPRRTFTAAATGVQETSLASAPAPAESRPSVDLQSQLEALLDTVWKAEADWRFNDRLDMALKQRRDADPVR